MLIHSQQNDGRNRIRFLPCVFGEFLRNIFCLNTYKLAMLFCGEHQPVFFIRVTRPLCLTDFKLDKNIYGCQPKNRGIPKSSISIGFSIIFTIHFGGFPPMFGNIHISPESECDRPLRLTAHFTAEIIFFHRQLVELHLTQR